MHLIVLVYGLYMGQCMRNHGTVQDDDKTMGISIGYHYEPSGFEGCFLGCGIQWGITLYGQRSLLILDWVKMECIYRFTKPYVWDVWIGKVLINDGICRYPIFRHPELED